MKKTKKTALTAAAFAAAVGLSTYGTIVSGTYVDKELKANADQFDNTTTYGNTTTITIQTVYGPPSYFNTDPTEETEPISETDPTDPLDAPDPVETAIPGDIDNDGQIDAFDLAKLRKLINTEGELAPPLTENGKLDYDLLEKADLTHDGAIDNSDIHALQAYLKGEIKKPTDFAIPVPLYGPGPDFGIDK